MAGTESTSETDLKSTLAYNQSFYARHYRNPFLALRYDLLYRSRRLHRLLNDAGVDLARPGFRSFEYGFGAAHLLKQLRASEVVVGCEFSRSAVASARFGKPSSHPHWHMIDWADSTSLPFRSDSFDLVACCHVLEHLPDDTTLLGEFVRIARGGGHLLIVLPAHESLFRGSKHLRLYEVAEFSDRLSGLGLTHIRIDEHQRFDRPWKAPSVILASRASLLKRIVIEGSKNALFLPPLMVSWRLLALLDRWLERRAAPSTSVAYLFKKPTGSPTPCEDTGS